MNNRQFKLREEEVEVLRQREQKTRDVHELKRLQAVRLYGSGEEIEVIQDSIGCGASSIRQWAMRYKAGGVKALGSRWQGKNANKLSAAQRVELKNKLHTYTPEEVIPPQVRVSQGVFWTVSDLQIVVQEWFGVEYQSLSSYYNLLHQSGFSSQKVATVYRSQPGANAVADFEAELEKK